MGIDHVVLSLKLQPDLNGALFVMRSGTKKREWKADTAAIKKIKYGSFPRFRTQFPYLCC